MELSKEKKKYLTLLAEKYPTKEHVSREIINLKAILNLPKGTEHFMSDIHGEYEAFYHILNNCSGVIREKVQMVFKDTLSTKEQQDLVELKNQVKEQQDLIAQKINDTNKSIQAYSDDIAKAEAAALEYEKKVEANRQAIDDESRRIEESKILEQVSRERASKEQASREQASREESIKNAQGKGDESETTSKPDNDTPIYTPEGNDLDMLAALIECEAGDQSYYGMLCVGAVVMNRINSSSFPDTLYEVLYQPYQFTPVTVSGRFALVLARGANETCYKAAREVLEQGNIVGSWLFFRMNDGSRQGEVIGDHVFY